MSLYDNVSVVILFCITYVSIVSSSTFGTADGNIELWFLGGRHLSVFGIDHETNGCTELVLWKGGVLGKILEYTKVISKGTYVRT